MEDNSVVNKLPVRFRKEVLRAGTDELEEIRLRIGQPLELYYGDRKIQLSACPVTDSDMRELLNYLTGYSLYAYEDEIRQGYFTIPGGHRIGVAGRTGTTWTGGQGSTWAGGRGAVWAGSGGSSSGRGVCSVPGSGVQQVTGIWDIGAVNIRIAHEHKGCAKALMPYIRRNINCNIPHDVHHNTGCDIYNTLIVAPPGVGKTTYLRDCIRLLSEGEEPDAEPLKVGVVDERSEIAACCRGVPQNDVGPRTDVLDGCPKRQGMRMLLRSMSPQVIAVDELGGAEDFQALYEVMHSGIRILGTVHAGSVEELYSRPYLECFLGEDQIERLILLRKDGTGARECRVYEMESGD